MKQVFWHHDCLVQTVFMQTDIGRVERPRGFDLKFYLYFGDIAVTSEEDLRASGGFATLAEARRFLEGVSKRLGYDLIGRKPGWAAFQASEKDYRAQV